MIRWFTPRKKGNGWKLQKFHDLLHLALDMERFGPPSNFDAGPMESGLRYWAKLPADTSQMRGYNTFAKQVAARTFEFQCFAKALRKHGLCGVRDPNPEKEEGKKKADNNLGTPGGTRYRIYANRINPMSQGGAIFKQTMPIRKNTCRSAFNVSRVVENFLRFQPKEEPHDWLPVQREGPDKFWELHTEVSLKLPMDGENMEHDIISTLRCHPNHLNEGPWYDWVIVQYKTDKKLFQDLENINTQYNPDCVPSKVLAIAKDPNDSNNSWLLVHGCEYRTTKEDIGQDSVLLEHWKLAYHDLSKYLPRIGRGINYDGTKMSPRDLPYKAPHLTWVRPENVLCRCLVIEEEPGIFETLPEDGNNRAKNDVLLVRQHKQWPLEFTDA
jgi:hypothetical protein